MKLFREKLGKMLAYVYGVGIAVSLLVGALSFIGYLVAIIVSGQLATNICALIYQRIYPVLFKVSSISVLIGLVKMYIVGEKTMLPSKK